MAIDDEIAFSSLLAISRKIADRTLSSLELTRQLIERGSRPDSSLNSFAFVCAETALREAQRADDEISRDFFRGPLHGVPVAVKDIVATRDAPTAAGMRLFAKWRPGADATVVARLRRAGAVIIAKAQTTEGATGAHHPDFPAPLNPWGRDRCAGFSSSGSGTSVAAGLCYAALGSDTAGSIRIPSAMNGLTGLKPTWGRVSRDGVFPLVEYLDTIGPMARNAADAAAILSAIAGPDPNDPTASQIPAPNYLATIDEGLSGAVVGVDLSALALCCSDQITAVIDQTADTLSSIGATLRAVQMPAFDPLDMFALVTAGMGDAHRTTYPSRADDYGPNLRFALDHAQAVAGIDVAKAMNHANLLRGRLDALFGEIDLLLVPALSQPTPLAGAHEEASISDPVSSLEMVRFMMPFNISGQPAIALQGGRDATGMPIGFQLVGRRFEEERLLRAGHAYQRVSDWHTRHPQL